MASYFLCLFLIFGALCSVYLIEGRPAYAEAGLGKGLGETYAKTGTSRFGGGTGSVFKGGALEAEAGTYTQEVFPGLVVAGAKAGATVHQHVIGNKVYNWENKFLTTDVEASSLGVFARASAYDGKIKLGPVAITKKIQASTGIGIKNGLEVKVLGLGGSIRKDGFEFCLWFCVGLNWG